MELHKRTRSDPKYISTRRNSAKRRRSSSDGRSYQNAVVFDNGAYTIKIGYGRDEEPRVMLNAIMKSKMERKRVFIGDQIDECRDLSGLFYNLPHDQGYIANFDVQKNIWDYALSTYNFEDNTVLLTQPILNFRNVQHFLDEVFFEDYAIKAMYKANPTDFAYYNYVKESELSTDVSAIVVDAGYSFTHIVPYIKGEKYAKGMMRLAIGGKILTNYLKDLISYRQLNVMEETYVINQVKEDVCYMAMNFEAELDRTKNTQDIVTDYVLPDFSAMRRGYLQHPSLTKTIENSQILRLNNERITIPEIMLNPSLIPGMMFAGVTECVTECIKLCPEEYRAEMCRNIVLCGGTSLFKGFRQRMNNDAQRMVPCDYKVTIHQHENADNYPWYGARSMTMDPDLKYLCATKNDYEEHGSNFIYTKFNQFYRDEKRRNNDVAKESFSYLNYWKHQGVDLFGKETAQPLKEPNVEFKLEGDDIDKYDGKHVTIQFEYEASGENTPPEEVTYESIAMPEVTRLRLRKSTNSSTGTSYTLLNRVPATVTKPMSTVNINTRSNVQSRSQIIAAGPSTRYVSVPKLTTPNILRKTGVVKSSSPIPKVSLANIVNQAKELAKTQPKIINSNITLPKLAQFVKPLNSNAAKKITQLKSVNLSDAFVIPTVGSQHKTLTTSKILNSAVIVPQNTASNKNLTFQIIPINREGKSSNKLTIIKKS